jgi:phage-related minor tail protein
MDHVSEMWAKEKAARAEKQRRNAELVKENTREENEREKSDEEEEEKEEEEEREDEELRSESDEETDRTQQQAIKANNKATKAVATEKPRESGGDGAVEDEANMRCDRALGVICWTESWPHNSVHAETGIGRWTTPTGWWAICRSGCKCPAISGAKSGG